LTNVNLKVIISCAMIVCHCHAISHRRILEVVQSGACTAREVARACAAGTSCGGCVPAIRELIEQAESEQQPQAATAAPALAPAFA
jgi:bacterioferritin-associated ferredoxin